MRTTRPADVPARDRARQRSTLLVGSVTAGALLLTACGTPAADLDDDLATAAAPTATFAYTGAVQQYTVPEGTTSLTVTASGGSGGTTETAGPSRSTGAQVTGTLAVQPGQVLLVSVGQQGEKASSHDTDPKGGWGGLGATGGPGNAASDSLRTGAAGGGATTIQLVEGEGVTPVTVLVAGGGGGDGGPSGDQFGYGGGGDAGCTGLDDAPWWAGTNGQDGSTIMGGKGGVAGAEPGMAGARGGGGSGLGGNGGGGGGGVNGGGAGTGARGTSGGGGGGAGTSTTTGMTDTAVACATQPGSEAGVGDGQVVLTPVPS